MKSHILKDYEDALVELREGLLEMGTLVENALNTGLKGFFGSDIDSCFEVIDGDEQIDLWEKKIDELGMGILLKFQPMARDLREVLSAINISRSLERMGDHAVTVAKRARRVIKADGERDVVLLEPLAAECRKIVRHSLTAVSDLSEEKSHETIEMDRAVDVCHKAATKQVTKLIGERPDSSKMLLNLVFIARSLERIGDLAVNIAEDVVFVATAEDIRH